MKLLASYAIGVSVVIGGAVAWLAVQIAWKRSFKSKCPDPDALANRGSCYGACGGHSGGSDDGCG